MQWQPFTPQAYADFIVAYPQYAAISQPTMQNLYLQVQVPAQPIIGLLSSVTTQAQYVNLALAHACELSTTLQPGRAITGTTNSITVNLDLDDKDAMATWWQQTQYGQQVWQILRLYRQYNGGARFFPSAQSLQRNRYYGRGF